jgi:transcriptional regulator GlxA family with amidase domain
MRQEQVDYQRIISARVLLILALATAILQRRTFGQSEIVGVIEKAKTILLEHFTEPVNIERLASDLGVGYSWFRRMFREYTGLPPAQYVLQLRLNKACELLRSTSVPIGVIGHTVGFESAYYFARIFREKMGRTPRDYRAMSQTQIDGPDTTPVWEAD